MIKAIFFDIDGTLLDHSPKGGGRIPPSTLRCLEALRKKGIKLFVATGRIPAMVTFLEDLFPFDGFVTLNGQLAWIGRAGCSTGWPTIPRTSANWRNWWRRTPSPAW